MTYKPENMELKESFGLMTQMSLESDDPRIHRLSKKGSIILMGSSIFMLWYIQLTLNSYIIHHFMHTSLKHITPSSGLAKESLSLF